MNCLKILVFFVTSSKKHSVAVLTADSGGAGREGSGRKKTGNEMTAKEKVK